MFSKNIKDTQKDKAREAEIQAIRKDTYKKIDTATKSMRKLNKLLLDKEDIAYNIWVANGAKWADGRSKK